MSKNRNRSKLNGSLNNKDYKKILLKLIYPPYWDDGIILYPTIRKGFKNPNKQIYNEKRREFRTWKHNRKTKWK